MAFTMVLWVAHSPVVAHSLVKYVNPASDKSNAWREGKLNDFSVCVAVRLRRGVWRAVL